MAEEMSAKTTIRVTPIFVLILFRVLTCRYGARATIKSDLQLTKQQYRNKSIIKLIYTLI